MQKIRIQISELSPHNIDCLANDLLLLGQEMDGEVCFELSDDSKNSLFLPSSAASADSLPIQIPFRELLSLSADRHYVNFSGFRMPPVFFQRTGFFPAAAAFF